mgnify:CR=1 FL=1
MLQGQSKKSEPISNRIDLIILANAKRMELSFAELNEFRLQDYVEYTNIFLGHKSTTVREATQEDIDKLLS